MQDSIDLNVNVIYNEHGKSFENLLADGIRRANIKAIQKQIIASNATSEKGVTNE